MCVKKTKTENLYRVIHNFRKKSKTCKNCVNSCLTHINDSERENFFCKKLLCYVCSRGVCKLFTFSNEQKQSITIYKKTESSEKVAKKRRAKKSVK